MNGLFTKNLDFFNMKRIKYEFFAEKLSVTFLTRLQKIV